jgi:hypothetical protein
VRCADALPQGSDDRSKAALGVLCMLRALRVLGEEPGGGVQETVHSDCRV